MEASQIPLLAWAAFGGAFVSGLALFVCVYFMTRRLGMTWEGRGPNWMLESGDAKRVFTLIYAGPGRLTAEGVADLVWAIRILWLVMLAGVVTFAVLLSGAA